MMWKGTEYGLKSKLCEITTPLIVTEGKSDWKHLKKAKENLGIDGNFSFYEYEEGMGDKELLKLCKSYSKLLNAKPLIFIFDRDNPEIIKEVLEKDKEFKTWGNNVFSFAIPFPSHRDYYKNISIEFYYTDDEIKSKDAKGRRLFLSSEFKERSGGHKTNRDLKIGNANKLKGVTEEKETKSLPKNKVANFIWGNKSIDCDAWYSMNHIFDSLLFGKP